MQIAALNKEYGAAQGERNALALAHGRWLAGAFDNICREANVYQGSGPPMAYFEMPFAIGCRKRYTYIAFGMTGEKPEGQAMAVCLDVNLVLQTSVKTFREWLKPNRTLVWRTKPEVDVNEVGYWASYWRCVQLDDDAKSLTIEWNF